MTADEWAERATLIDNLWSQGFTEGQAVAYFHFLADYDVADVDRAIALCVQSGSEWLPSCASLVALIEREDIPTFDEAMAMVRRAIVRDPYDGVALRDIESPVVRAWAAAKLREIRYAPDNEYARREWRKSYEQHVAQHERRARHHRADLVAARPRTALHQTNPITMIGGPSDEH